MKTIAITMDENTLGLLDRLLENKSAPGKNRSQVIRLAVREYLANLEQQADFEKEREIFHRQRGLLKKQAAALVKAQAKP
jgi:metal-responsive CopG/Arc/MetJ family transcriptional regulator